MEKDWVLVYTTQQDYKAELLAEIFEDNGIEHVAINKKDSSYVVLGEIEFYVHQDQEIHAKTIIKEFDSE